MAKISPAAAEDVGNIMALEHVNLQVPDQRTATVFYILGLGLTRDPYMNVGDENMWVNIGQQQFHLPTRPAQVLPGHVTLVMPDLDALEQRLRSVEGKLAGTLFRWAREGDHVSATCPWGNRFRCYGAGTIEDMTLGVPEVEFLVKPGIAAWISKFYHQALGAQTSLERDGNLATARVEVGARQSLAFKETFEPIRAYDGHHIAIYIGNVSGPYKFFRKRGLVMEDLHRHQFRFKDIVDPDTGTVIYHLEHEVRTLRHPMFKRPLVNRDPTLTMVANTAPMMQA